MDPHANLELRFGLTQLRVTTDERTGPLCLVPARWGADDQRGLAVLELMRRQSYRGSQRAAENLTRSASLRPGSSCRVAWTDASTRAPTLCPGRAEQRCSIARLAHLEPLELALFPTLVSSRRALAAPFLSSDSAAAHARER